MRSWRTVSILTLVAGPMTRAVQGGGGQRVAEKIIAGRLLPGSTLEFTLEDFPELAGVSPEQSIATPVVSRDEGVVPQFESLVTPVEAAPPQQPPSLLTFPN